MKRLWIGVLILLLLPAAGIGTAVCLDRSVDRVVSDLRTAQAAAAAGALEEARSAAETARQTWEKHRPLAACVADHAPLELVDQAFRELALWARAGDSSRYEALCIRLCQQLNALTDGELPCYYNIL